jgi:hypothetical protein
MNRTPKLSKQIKLLILTADSSPHIKFWKHKVSNANICICDAEKGGGLVIFGVDYYALRVKVAPFIYEELSCIYEIFHGSIYDEAVGIGCCC